MYSQMLARIRLYIVVNIESNEHTHTTVAPHQCFILVLSSRSSSSFSNNSSYSFFVLVFLVYVPLPLEDCSCGLHTSYIHRTLQMSIQKIFSALVMMRHCTTGEKNKRPAYALPRKGTDAGINKNENEKGIDKKSE